MLKKQFVLKSRKDYRSLDGVKRITSNASENVGSVNSRDNITGEDPSDMLDKIKAEVDAM